MNPVHPLEESNIDYTILWGHQRQEVVGSKVSYYYVRLGGGVELGQFIEGL
jgi:hypothetical protein